MNVDELIEAKQNEIRENHKWIANSDFIGEVTTGQPMKMNSMKDLTEYTLHIRVEELLNSELELLLDSKYPENIRGDHASLETRAQDLSNEVAALKLELEE